jgi:hypothetical protein
MKAFIVMLKLAWKTAVFLFELLFWSLRKTWHLGQVATDFVRAEQSMRDGQLHCPNGHAVPTEGIFECGACKFTYAGSVWLCGNPECQATTPYTNCPICGLSVRNPNRWGRP